VASPSLSRFVCHRFAVQRARAKARSPRRRRHRRRRSHIFGIGMGVRGGRAGMRAVATGKFPPVSCWGLLRNAGCFVLLLHVSSIFFVS
jgi:hypothetical protein